MTLAEFARRYNGRKVGGGQCVALVRRWVTNIRGVQPGPVRGARELFQTASAKHWRKIRNTPPGVPPEGSIVVFDARPGNRYGHAAIGRKGSTTRKLLTFDQNWSRAHRCTLEVHDYTKDRVIGWLVKR